ncbi:MAG: hypothetical protein LBQ76_02470, partial [Candidatus Fibromonas sp.]|nr:hypothetical protein [Candidatus Fibromonas sp.]
MSALFATICTICGVTLQGNPSSQNRANTQVCPYNAHHHCTIRPATPQTGDRKGRPYIVLQFRHWGAGAIVGATFTVALVWLPWCWVF